MSSVSQLGKADAEAPPCPPEKGISCWTKESGGGAELLLIVVAVLMTEKLFGCLSRWNCSTVSCSGGKGLRRSRCGHEQRCVRL